ncbi:hypothetical protein BKA61DRAFT_702162 [Leptodontidium sp. MPI-SDFR-AT-0119]|nr:hypothetical protein BKA61DRAFT_702162 [Leptodontidium sp. MPI-SDFR-AT-0119]
MATSTVDEGSDPSPTPHTHPLAHIKSTISDATRKRRIRCCEPLPKHSWPQSELPEVLNSSSTLLGSSGLQVAQTNLVDSSMDLGWRSIMDRDRAVWEEKWGLVAELNFGDWMLVKWVTSRYPVFKAPEILVLANDILDQRRIRFPNELNTEELLMRILEEILHMYTVIAGSSRILDTLIHFNVGNRRRIFSGVRRRWIEVSGITGAEA